MNISENQESGLAEPGISNPPIKKHPPLSFLEVTKETENHEVLIEEYHHLLRASFRDPNDVPELEDLKDFLDLKANNHFEANNPRIFLAQNMEGKTIGATAFIYLAKPNAGILELICSHPEYRGEGIADQLLTNMKGVLQKEAKESGKPQLSYIFAEVSDPYLVDHEDSSTEEDKKLLKWYGKRGYNGIDFSYIAPALPGEEKTPAAKLLIFSNPNNSEAKTEPLSVAFLKEIIHGIVEVSYQILPEDCNEYQEMLSRLDNFSEKNLITFSLSDYQGKRIDVPTADTKNKPVKNSSKSLLADNLGAILIEVIPDQLPDNAKGKYLQDQKDTQTIPEATVLTEERHWEKDSEKFKSALQKVVTKLKPKTEYRGIWEGEQFIGRFKKEENGIVFFSQVQQIVVVPGTPQNSMLSEIIRAIDRDFLINGSDQSTTTSPFVIGQKYSVTVPIFRINKEERDRLSEIVEIKTPDQELSPPSNFAPLNQAEYAAVEEAVKANVAQAKTKKQALPIKIVRPNGMENFAQIDLILVDKEQRAFYIQPAGQVRELDVIVMTIAERAGELLPRNNSPADVKYSINYSGKKARKIIKKKVPKLC